jgi:hypothetical protein
MEMDVTFMRDGAKEMPNIPNCESVRSMKIWHCKFRTLVPLKMCRNLKVLCIATFPDESLDVLSSLSTLSVLHILHLPKVTDLSPLSSLTNLESLSLQTLPSWDSSGKVQTVDSLEPLAKLPHLKHLELFGVRPEDKSLVALESCAGLKTARFSKFPKQEVARFYDATGIVNEFNPESPL